ncbi:MAG: hypothetical protein FWG58_04575 [Methanomassiliicoccaceae archaeon]|nr:hypothetical protein [Methanomassiliicoccaceae archaeon]
MKMTIRDSVFETNSSSEHAFMYMSKETFEKWRRGEVRMKGNGYPVCDLTDDDFIATNNKPDTVCDPLTNEHSEKEGPIDNMDMTDSPVINADLSYVLRKYFVGKEHNKINFDKWDGSYVSMLLIFLRHHGECVSREQANKRYVDPEEWGPTYEEVLEVFRNALNEIEEWKEIGNKKYSEFRKIINDIRNKEEITAEDVQALWSIMFDMRKHKIKDEKFRAFADAFSNLENHDIVYQNAHIDLTDKGEKVRIHIWGRDDGY